MAEYVVEVTGELYLNDAREYMELLSGIDDLDNSESRLSNLLGRLSNINLSKDQGRDGEFRNSNRARNLIDAELYEVLHSYESSIARDITRDLQKFRLERLQRHTMHEIEPKPQFHVSVRFGRGSILYTVVITLLETSGPHVASTAIGSLVVAAIEPMLVAKARSICHAGELLTSNLRSVIERSPVEAYVEPTAGWMEDKAKGYNKSLETYAAISDQTGTYRRWRAVVLILLGLTMANIAALIVVASKVGLLFGRVVP
jgi:hypothetical protein